jgi:hypothetical protein
MRWAMNEYLWFWLIAAMLILLGMIFWAVFFRGSPPKRKLNKLHEILFRKER